MRSSARPERSARAVAFRVLVRVAADGAFASMALDAELERAKLDERDSRLASAIVYGTLRELEAIDRIVDAKLARKAKLDVAARAALRGSVFQLAGLDRQPAHAVVDEAVRWVRAERDARVAGFVNAVLRRIVADAPRLVPEGPALDPEIRAMLARSLGERRAESFRARTATPPIDLRVADVATRDALVDRLRHARPRAIVAPARFSPRGIRTYRVGDPRELPGAAEGEFVVQEEGSQIIAALVGARPGESVLDVCAGRGGKTTFLAAAVGATGTIVATDVHEHRLEQIASTFTRLGLAAKLETHAVDFTVGAGGLGATFDRVLVDAPCSGLGTLHRRPEIALRVTADTVRALVATQSRILERAARCVKVGGTLVYAVCSPLDEESRAVVAAASLPGLVALPFAVGETFGIEPDADGSLTMGPFLSGDGLAGEGDGPDEGTDGYRVFRFSRVDSVGIEG